MNKQHPYIVNTSEKEMDAQFEHWRQVDIERAAREIQQLEGTEEDGENLWGAPARKRYNS